MRQAVRARAIILGLMLGACCLAATNALTAAELSPDDAQAIDRDVRPFLTAHCLDCHGPDEAKAGLRLDKLSTDLSNVETFRTWTKVLDRTAAGEMPPKDSAQPTPTERGTVTGKLNQLLVAADLRKRPPAGSLVLRRLNRLQYENTIRDLLAIDLEVQERLPADGRAFGFDNVGAALSLSSAQLEAYLEAADAALDSAIVTKPKPVGVKLRMMGLEAVNERTARNNGTILEQEDVAIVFGKRYFYASGRDAAPEDGKYRVRISAYAYQTDGKPIEIFLDSTHKTGDRVIGYYNLQPGVPQVLEVVCTLKKDSRVRINTSKFNYALRSHRPEDRTEQGLAVQWVEFEGPLLDSWPRESHKRLFGELPMEMVSEYHKIMSVRSEQPQADAERLLTGFMRKAYRRPIADHDLEPILTLVKQHLDGGSSFEEAMRVGYKAILCSPDFLFFQETPGQADEFALASRLSYFLWNTLPDDELMQLAERSELSRPEVLRDQVERLLKDPRSKRFVQNFLAQWLNLREIDFTTPDRKLYPEFDTALREAMVDETELFFEDLLQNDSSLLNLIQSDYSFLNERLAAHYGISGVAGAEMRRTSLPPDCHRGGVMTMASVLKVTANGSYTHPVTRGVWMLRNIVGRPPEPPPPNAGAVEPDLRGLKTIREQLSVHRRDQACNGCHVKIDPLGFALESYDVTGAWREKYRVLKGEQLSLSKDGPPVEAAYEMPDGRIFRNMDELKQILLEDKPQLARSLAEKLLIYSTGKGLQFADRTEVQKIVDQVTAKNYGLRSLIHEIVQSPLFLNDDHR